MIQLGLQKLGLQLSWSIGFDYLGDLDLILGQGGICGRFGGILISGRRFFRSGLLRHGTSILVFVKIIIVTSVYYIDNFFFRFEGVIII